MNQTHDETQQPRDAHGGIYIYPTRLAPLLIGFRDGVPILRVSTRPTNNDDLDAIVDDVACMVFPHLDPDQLTVDISAHWMIDGKVDFSMQDDNWIEIAFCEPAIDDPSGRTEVCCFIIRWA